MFGGYDGQAVFDDIYILDLSTCAYLPQITDFQVMACSAMILEGVKTGLATDLIYPHDEYSDSLATR